MKIKINDHNIGYEKIQKSQTPIQSEQKAEQNTFQSSKL